MNLKKTVNIDELAGLLGMSLNECRNNHEDIQEFILKLQSRLDEDQVIKEILSDSFNGVLQSTASSTQFEPFFGEFV